MVFLDNKTERLTRINDTFTWKKSIFLVAHWHILLVLKENRSKWILLLITCNLSIIYFLHGLIDSTNSLALKAYISTVYFNVFSLMACLISIWVELNNSSNYDLSKSLKAEYAENAKSTNEFTRKNYYSFQEDPIYPSNRTDHSVKGYCTVNNAKLSENRLSTSVFGLQKYEVLALLLSSSLILIVETFIFIEAFARVNKQPIVYTSRLGASALLGLATHILTIIIYPDAKLDHVVCRALPCPTLKGQNPIIFGNLIGFLVLCSNHAFMHYWNVYIADTAAAFVVISVIIMAILPLGFYTASIIFQRLPDYMIEQLDKYLREALMIDGVLEFRNEVFWTKSFGKLAGSIEVRIRQNANEKLVLNNVTNHLSIIVSHLKVREFCQPRNNYHDRAPYPMEYYINELLPDNDKYFKEDLKGEEDAQTIINIDDFLGLRNLKVETFTILSEKNKHQLSSQCAISSIQNISTKEYLRINNSLLQRLDTKNPLLLGTDIQLQNSYITPQINLAIYSS
ncbi:zinc transporter 6-like [Prorops nasuta]|uniref:zinc transporter 6-like n=1 Tax=Prorops nasuta TaxID=863751 RepID=UPI0034CEFE8C